MTTENQETLEDFVERLVKRHPSAARSYNLLILFSFFYKTGNRNFINFTNHDLAQLPSSESLTRAWRAVKERKPELADPDMEDVRAERQEYFRQHYSRRANL